MELDKNGIAVDVEDVSVTIVYESKEEADWMKEAMADGRVQFLEWHPIEIREGEIEEIVGLLPEEGQEVILTTKGGFVTIDVFDYVEAGGFFENYDFDEVLAWAPMPEPYKKRED